MTTDDDIIRLHGKLVEVLGAKDADTLMTLLLSFRWELIAQQYGVTRPDASPAA